MTISPRLLKGIQGAVPNENTEILGCEEDHQLITLLYQGYQNHLDEMYLRQLVYSYIEKFIEITQQDFLYDPMWGNRIEGWKTTLTYQTLKTKGNRDRISLFQGMGVIENISKLIYLENIETDELIRIYFELDQAVQLASDYQLIEILAHLPPGDGSAYPFSFGLFHARPEIYTCAARIILRVFIQKLGPQMVNPMIKLAVQTVISKKSNVL